MDFQVLVLLLVSAFGIGAGIYGYLLYQPGFNLHAYIGGKMMLGCVVIGIATTIVITNQYDWLRGLIHLLLYVVLTSAGMVAGKQVTARSTR